VPVPYVRRPTESKPTGSSVRSVVMNHGLRALLMRPAPTAVNVQTPGTGRQPQVLPLCRGLRSHRPKNDCVPAPIAEDTLTSLVDYRNGESFRAGSRAQRSR
jgi:hypothetical protein